MSLHDWQEKYSEQPKDVSQLSLLAETHTRHTESMVLTAKISKPPLPTNIMSRSHLFEKLNKGLQRKLTLITAPAGYGKTTLLNEWVRSITDSHTIAAWLSIDWGDTNATRFLSHMITLLVALDIVRDSAALTRFSLAESSSIENIFTMLINAFMDVPQDLVLILDNYPVIDTPVVHKGIAFLLEYLPRHIHLIIAGRTRPPLPWARLRIEDQLVEIDATDMRYIASREAMQFLKQAFGKVPGKDALGIVENYIEGWGVGLHVAANVLQEHVTTTNLVIGYHHYIRDYLNYEVFAFLPEHLQDFLLKTAILDDLSGSVCDAVTERNDSLLLFEWLERNSLFIFPLENQPGKYRYHKLFRDFLLGRLQSMQPNLIPMLHLRAKKYYEQNGLAGKAIDHALAANDIESAIYLIEEIWITIMEKNEISVLQRWFENIPAKLISSSPKIALLCVRYQFIIGDFSAVKGGLREIKRQLAAMGEVSETVCSPDAFTEMVKEIEFLYALLAAVWCNAPLEAGLPISLLKQISARNIFLQNVGLLNASIVYWLKNDRGLAVQPFSLAKLRDQDDYQVYGELMALCLLAQMHQHQGHLRQAELSFKRALEIMNLGNGALQKYKCQANLGLGQIFYERNDLDTAMMYLSECITLSQQQNNEEMLAYSYTLLARIKQVLGEEECALQLIRFAEQQAQKRHLSSRVGIYIALCHTRLLLARGEIESAIQELQRSGLYNFNHPLQARILLAQCKYDEAGEVLDRLFTNSKLSRKIGSMIETQLLLALVYRKQNRMFESLEFFERALSLAQKEGYCRLFVNEGAYIGELIEIFIEREQQKDTSLSGPLVEYAKRLLSTIKIPVDDTTLAYKSKFIKFNQSLVEPLRERELEVLYLIAIGLSNQEIAQRMVVAISTVKWHIKNIYSKLTIRSRAEAIALVHKHVQLL